MDLEARELKAGRWERKAEKKLLEVLHLQSRESWKTVYN